MRNAAGLCAGGNFLDLEHGQFLAMTALSPIILAALFLEDDHFRAACLLHDFRRDRRTRDHWRADLGRFSADGQNFIERDCAADLAGEPFDRYLVADADAVLLSARL